jgi:hypothetical protein
MVARAVELAREEPPRVREPQDKDLMAVRLQNLRGLVVAVAVLVVSEEMLPM